MFWVTPSARDEAYIRRGSQTKNPLMMAKPPSPISWTVRQTHASTDTRAVSSFPSVIRARPATPPAAGLRRCQSGLCPFGQPGTFVLCQGSEHVKMRLPCALVVSSHGSARDRNPVPRLPQHRHYVRQIRRTPAQPGEVGDHPDIAWLQIVQALHPPRPGLRRPGSVFLEHPAQDG